MGAGAEEEAVGALERAEELRVESGELRDRAGGECSEGEAFNGGAAGEEAASLGEEDGGITGFAGERGVEEKKMRAAGGHGSAVTEGENKAADTLSPIESNSPLRVCYECT